MNTKLRDCAVCGHPVIQRPYQAITARACSPSCAQSLASREHPDLKPKLDRMLDEVGKVGVKS